MSPTRSYEFYPDPLYDSTIPNAVLHYYSIFLDKDSKLTYNS
jgi:hypothetical protein